MPAAARQTDPVQAQCTHTVVPPSGPPVPTPLPFTGTITAGTSPDVTIDGLAAATAGATVQNNPPHLPPGGTFAAPPTNTGSIQNGSATVTINGRPAARVGDPVLTCSEVPAPGTVQSGSPDVMIGG